MNYLPTQGRWRGILAALGVPPDCLTGKHCGCPLCPNGGGKDRFRFDDKGGTGTWICNACGAGTGFGLVMRFRGVDFPEARRLVEGVLGQSPAEPVRAPDARRQHERAMAVWGGGKPLTDGDGVDAYLAARGLHSRPPALRWAERCRTSRGEFRPAMLALVCDVEGNGKTVHRTYLAGARKADIESPRELMPGKVPVGGAVRLAGGGPVLGVAEGIETALAAAELFDVPVWAAVTAGLLERFEPPPGTEAVVVFADADKSFTGQAAAYSLAKRLTNMRRLMNVKVEVPDNLGEDWNDVWLKKVQQMRCPEEYRRL